jgi:hypothetical protein
VVNKTAEDDMGKIKKRLKAARKLGSARNEFAVKGRKVGGNFKLSRDVREDRGMRQSKLGRPKGR